MTGKLDKARAVFLAALMVVSVFGGTMAFAGTAAAADGSVSLDADYYTASDSVTITVEDSDENSDDASTETLTDAVTVTTDTGDSVVLSVTETGKDTGVFTAENANIDAASATADSDIEAANGNTVSVSYTDSGGSQRTASARFDDKAPTGSDKSPASGDEVSSPTEPIEINLNDEHVGIDTSTVNLVLEKTSNDQEFVDLTSTNDAGIDYDPSNGVLTVTPGQGSVPELPTGEQIQVTLNANDKAGNPLTQVQYTFTVNQQEPTFALASNSITNSPTAGVDITVEDGGSYADIKGDSVIVTVRDESGAAVSGYDGIDVSSSSLLSYAEGNGADDDDTLTISPDSSNKLPEGQLSIEAVGNTATDGSGESFSGTVDYEVDTSKPMVTDLYTDASFPVTSSGDVQVTVEFNDSMQSEPTVNLNGLVTSYTLDSDDGSYVNDQNTKWVGTFSLNNDGEENVGSLEVSSTSAQDMAGNGLLQANPDNGETIAKSIDFTVDTIAPTVSPSAEVESDVNGADSIEGSINLEKHFDIAQANGNTPTYEIITADTFDTDAESSTTVSNVKNYDTTNKEDGYYYVRATATDDTGTSTSGTFQVLIDNHEPSVSPAVEDGYTARGEVTLGELFNVENGEVAHLKHDSGSDSLSTTVTANSDSQYVIDTTTLTDGSYTVEAAVDEDGDPGNSETAQVEINVDNIFGVQSGPTATDVVETGGTADGTYQVSFTTDARIGAVNVTVVDTDKYYKQYEETLNASDFGQPTETTDGNFKYTTTWTAPRDGDFEVRLLGATTANDARTLDGALDTGVVGTDSAIVDLNQPTIDDADLLSADESSTTIRVEFSEPVSTLGAATFGGENVIDNKNADSSLSEGYTTVVLDDEYQTGGDKQIAFGSIENNENVTETSADVTYSLDLSEGLNVVSIPAETGGVALDDLNLDEIGVDSVMEYDATNGDNETSYLDEWAAYDAQTSEGQLQYLEGGDGYVIVANESTELDIEVKNVPRDGATRISQENLEAGWNLVGAFQEGSQNVDQAFSGLTDQVWSVQTGYSGDQPSNLEGGQGYWLSVNKDAVYVPVDYTGAQSEQPTLSNVQIGSSSKTYGAGETIDVSLNIDHDVTIETVKVMSDDLGIDAQYEASEFTTGDKKVQPSVADPVPSSVSTATVTVAVVDAHGNIEYARQDVSVDSQAPTVSNFAVTNTGQTVDVSFDSDEQLSTISVTGGDDASSTTLAKVDFAETGDAQSGYTYTVQLSSGSDGTFSATLDSAVDANGNDGASSESDTVTVDTTEPSISGFSVDNTESQTVEVSFDSNEQLSTISVSGGDDASGTTLAKADFTETGDAQSGYTYTAQLSSGSDGTFSATLDSAVDANGNDGASSESDSATVDTTAPSLDSATRVSDTEIDVTVSDGVDVDESTISASDFSLGSGSISSIATSEAGGTTTVTLTVSGVSYPVDVNIASGQTISDSSGNTLDDTASAVSTS